MLIIISSAGKSQISLCSVPKSSELRCGIFKMKCQFLFLALASYIRSISAVGVSGAAEGFAKGVTGGGSATPVYPSTTAELISYLGDSSARVIVLTKTYVD